MTKGRDIGSLDEAQSLGEAFRYLRKLRGLSHAAASARGGISKAALIRIEQDQRDPKLQTLEGVALALNCEIVVGPDVTYVRPLDDIEAVSAAENAT